jgi:hypothetical protein
VVCVVDLVMALGASQEIYVAKIALVTANIVKPVVLGLLSMKISTKMFQLNNPYFFQRS